MNSVETIIVILCLKLLYPTNVYLLRGSHEIRDINPLYWFFDECSEFYTEDTSKLFNDVFDYLQLATVISKRIFCAHGGISKQMKEPSIIQDVKRPLKEIKKDGLVHDLYCFRILILKLMDIK